VSPLEDLEQLRHLIDMRFNTLVLGRAGSSQEELLDVLTGALEGSGRRAVRLSARGAQTPTELLNRIADTLAVDAVSHEDAVWAAYLRLLTAADSHPDVFVVVEDVPGELGHHAFGRLRDELWALGWQWLVTGHAEEQQVLLAPPAEGFFERCTSGDPSYLSAPSRRNEHSRAAVGRGHALVVCLGFRRSADTGRLKELLLAGAELV
jgi:hypothetical protein